MKIDLTGLQIGVPEPIRCEYNPEALELNTQDFEFTVGIVFEGEVEKGEGFLQIRGRVSARWKETCGRCLARVERPFETQIDLNFAVSDDEHFYDFTPELREEVILTYPVKFLCKEDCQGLCPHCGANLNVSPCDCTEGKLKSSSPFSVLKKLKKESDNA